MQMIGGYSLKSIKRKAANKNVSLVFVEMIVSLLFFSFSSVIILNVFASANNKSIEAERNEHINLVTQSISELFSVYGDINIVSNELFGTDMTEAERSQLPECILSSEYEVNNEQDLNKYFYLPNNDLSAYNITDSDISLFISLYSTQTDAGSLNQIRIYTIYKGFIVYSQAASAYLPEF